VQIFQNQPAGHRRTFYSGARSKEIKWREVGALCPAD